MIYQALVAICRGLGSTAEVPELSKVLGSWALPMLAEALEEEEEERRANELFDFVKNLGEKKGDE